MAYDGQARRAQKHHPDLPALTRPRTEPGRERLAVSPSELALKHRLLKLRRHPRRGLRRMAKAHRSARTDHIHRNAGPGLHRPVKPRTTEALGQRLQSELTIELRADAGLAL